MDRPDTNLPDDEITPEDWLEVSHWLEPRIDRSSLVAACHSGTEDLFLPDLGGEA